MSKLAVAFTLTATLISTVIAPCAARATTGPDSAQLTAVYVEFLKLSEPPIEVRFMPEDGRAPTDLAPLDDSNCPGEELLSNNVKYRADINFRESPSWFSNYTITAYGKTTTQSISIRIPNDIDGPINIRMAILSEKNILHFSQRITKRESTPESLFEKYFTSQFLFYQNPELGVHESRINALKYWYESLRRIPEIQNIVINDEEVYRAAYSLSKHAATDKIERTVLNNRLDGDYKSYFEKNYKDIIYKKWEDLKNINTLIRQQKTQEASLLYFYYFNLYETINAFERQQIKEFYNIDKEHLRTFASTIAQTYCVFTDRTTELSTPLASTLLLPIVKKECPELF